MELGPRHPPCRVDETGRPESLVVGRPVVHHDGSCTTLHFPIGLRVAGEADAFMENVSFHLNRHLPSEGIGLEPAMAMALMPAMVKHWNLEAQGPLSPVLLDALDLYLSLYTTWQPTYRRPVLQAPSLRADVAPGLGEGRRAALLFSGGIDSMHSLLRLKAEISDLVFITGFDIPTHKTAHARLARDAARRMAETCGLGLIEVETDVRRFLDRHVPWIVGAGSVLGTVALLLRPLFHTVWVAPDFAWNDLRSESLHPLLHETWRTETFRLRCDSLALNRAEKTGVLAEKKEWLRHLRVCWELHPTHLNCGRCEKCLRTMTALAIHDALDDCPAFAVPLDLERLRGLEVQAKWVRFYEQMVVLAEARGKSEIREALRHCLREARWRSIAGSLDRAKDFVPESHAWHNHVKHLRDKLFDAWWETSPDWVWGRIRRMSHSLRGPIGSLLFRRGRWHHWRRVAGIRFVKTWRKWLVRLLPDDRSQVAPAQADRKGKDPRRSR